MKNWRRSYKHSERVSLGPALTLIAVGGSLVEAEDCSPYVGKDIVWEFSLTGNDPWTPGGSQVVVQATEVLDGEGHVGEFMRARIEEGGTPLTEWSPAVEVLA